MTNDKWTKGAPTTEGFYWCVDTNEDVELVRAYLAPRGILRYCIIDGTSYLTDESIIAHMPVTVPQYTGEAE